jgi:hypothetical protein
VGDILILKAFVICKTEPLSCFSCKIHILQVVPPLFFLQNRGDTKGAFVGFVNELLILISLGYSLVSEVGSI